MPNLYNQIVHDAGILDLLVRITSAGELYRKGVMMVAGFEDQVPERQRTPLVYSNRQEFKQKFPAERPNFNGRVMMHQFGTNVYYCITDIVKTEGEGWVILGDGQEEKIQAHFETLEELRKNLSEVCSKIHGYALIHELGTNLFRILEVKTHPTTCACQQ